MEIKSSIFDITFNGFRLFVLTDVCYVHPSTTVRLRYDLLNSSPVISLQYAIKLHVNSISFSKYTVCAETLLWPGGDCADLRYIALLPMKTIKYKNS